MDDSGENTPYEVGYGKPPKANQFKGGQSGNPGGRPPGHQTMKSLVDKHLNSTIVITEGGETREITKREALVLRTVNDAVRTGNLRPLQQLGAFKEDPMDRLAELPLSFTLKLEEDSPPDRWGDEETD